MTTIVYRSSDVTQSGQYTAGGGNNAFYFTTNVGATNITYGITAGVVTNVTINFFCNASGVSGYTDIVTGPTSYAIYSPYNASTALFTSGNPNAVATNISIIGGTIRITGSGEQHSNAIPAASRTVTFDASFNLNAISATTDFVFVNTSATSNPPNNILFLPPLNESQSSNSKLLFIKDKSANASINNITVVPNQGFCIDNINAPFTIKDNNGCLALFNDGIGYFIANYYPSNGQPAMPTSQISIVPTLYANNNTVNAFATSTTDRNTGNNSIYLRNPAGITGISIIKYYGAEFPSSSRTINNPLIIKPDGCNVDGSNTIFPMLYVDDPIKSCGAVFITDGTNWFIAGYYNSTNWNWTSYVPLGGTETQLSQYSLTDIKLKAPTGMMNPGFITPQTISATSYLCIIKKQGIPQGANTNYFSYALGNPTSGNFSLRCNNIVYTQPQNNTCLWLVAHLYAGVVLTYDPVIGYTA